MATEKVRLASVHCYNASADMLLNLTIPKERCGGSYEVKCMISAFNPTSKEAHIYAEFERVRSNLLERALERHGATGIRIESFSLQDYLNGSGHALRFVQTKSADPGFYLIEKGSPYVSPAPATSINSILSAGPDPMPLEAVKSLEQSVDRAEERAQMLEDQLKLKEDEKQAMVRSFQFSS